MTSLNYRLVNSRLYRIRLWCCTHRTVLYWSKAW